MTEAIPEYILNVEPEIGANASSVLLEFVEIDILSKPQSAIVPSFLRKRPIATTEEYVLVILILLK